MATPRDETGYSSSEEALDDSILSLGNSDASTDVSSVKSFDTDDDSTTNARHICLTEPNGYSDVRIGYDDEITRWIKGAELYYVICKEEFPNTLANSVESAMREAVSMWQGRGAKLTQVHRDDKATFAVTYEPKGNNGAYARSFFPNDEAPHKLMVYDKSRKELKFLANILAHEIGHILGLRHEFAHVSEQNNRSELIGIENLDSVMNYHPHVSHLGVKKSDLEGLDCLYALEQPTYKGLPIVDIDPEKCNVHFSLFGSTPVSSFNSHAVDIEPQTAPPAVAYLVDKPTMLFMGFITFLVFILILFCRLH